MAARNEEMRVLDHMNATDSICMCNHRPSVLARLQIKEANVLILMSSDCHVHERVRNHTINLLRSKTVLRIHLELYHTLRLSRQLVEDA